MFNWIDTKIEITDDAYSHIKKSDLQKYVIANCFDNKYHENVDFVKQILKNYSTSTFSKISKSALINISMLNIEIHNL